MATGNRQLVLKMSVSVDGFVSGPNGEIDWIFRTSAPDSAAWVVNTLREADAHLMGSRTYADMAAFWPFSNTPFTAPMNDIPKIVFSRTGRDAPHVAGVTRALADAKADRGKQREIVPTEEVLLSWADPTVASGDLADEIRKLKEQPGNFILAHGGARFAQSLVATGLIDEYRLVIHPVVLGKGKPLFSELSKPADLKLVSATSFSSGAVAMVYHPT